MIVEIALGIVLAVVILVFLGLALGFIGKHWKQWLQNWCERREFRDRIRRNILMTAHGVCPICKEQVPNAEVVTKHNRKESVAHNTEEVVRHAETAHRQFSNRSVSCR